MFIYFKIHVQYTLLSKSSAIKSLASFMLAVEHLTLMNCSSCDLDQFYLSCNICFFFKFLVSRIFIMFKCHLDHFLLTEFIFVENVQMSFSCDHCAHLLFLCVLVNSSEKCSKCVHVKKLCSFSS